ncbi:hypothetical protein NGB58_13540 [Escherichia coli]|nr:hypothetical protein [Escherichia coli]
MQKPEPVIIAPDYTDDELYEWMRKKLRAASDLKQANSHKERITDSLASLEQEIAILTQNAALNVSRMVKY